MKTESKWRDIKVVLVVSFVAIAAFMGFANYRGKTPGPQSNIDPNSPWRISDTSNYEANIALSPDGLLVAGVCPAKNQTPSPSGNNQMELVVWDIANKQELSRTALDHESDSYVQWSSNIRFIGTSGRYGQVYNWKSKTSVNAPIARVITGGLGNTDLDVDKTWLLLDSDLKVHSNSDDSVQAYRISTGMQVPVKWRARKSVSDTPVRWNMAVRPTAPGAPLQAVMVLKEPTPEPRVTPTPFPTPTPQPTPNAAQKAFLEKERQLDEEVSGLMEKLQSDEPPSDAEAQKLEARVKAINQQLKEERAQLFPPGKPTPTPIPYVTPQGWNRVELWNLQSNKMIWQKRFKTEVFDELKAFWSPDGNIIALFGSNRTVDKATSDRDRGIEFIDATTGKTLASATAQQGTSSLSAKKIAWVPGPRLVMLEKDEKYKPVLRFINATTGKDVAQWKLKLKFDQIDCFSVDVTGTRWAFASGRSGWDVYRGEEINSP